MMDIWTVVLVAVLMLIAFVFGAAVAMANQRRSSEAESIRGDILKVDFALAKAQQRLTKAHNDDLSREDADDVSDLVADAAGTTLSIIRKML